MKHKIENNEFARYKRSLLGLYGVMIIYTVLYLVVFFKIGLETSLDPYKRMAQESVWGFWFFAVNLHSIIHGKSYSFSNRIRLGGRADIFGGIQELADNSPPKAVVFKGAYLYFWAIPILCLSAFFMIRGLITTYNTFILFL